MAIPDRVNVHDNNSRICRHYQQQFLLTTCSVDWVAYQYFDSIDCTIRRPYLIIFDQPLQGLLAVVPVATVDKD